MSGPHINAHQELQHLLGGYVLGGLSATDRHRLEEHLPGCPECRAELNRFAVVPGLLQLAAVSGVDPEPPTPMASLPRLLGAARARRRRQRWRLLAAVAATVVVLAGAVFGYNLVQRPAPPPPSTPLVAIEAADQQPSGHVVLESKEWGTQIRLTMYYAGAPASALTAWAVAADGYEERAANWTTPEDGRCYVIGATSIKRDKLAMVEIRTTDGQTVLRGDG